MKLGEIILVDDSRDDLFLTQSLLERAGVRNVIIALDHAEPAMALLRGAAVSKDRVLLPCLVISDVRMPGINGIEFLRWVRSEPGLEHLPFALLTTGNVESERVEAEELHASAFLPKFPRPEVFASLVAAAMEGRLAGGPVDRLIS